MFTVTPALKTAMESRLTNLPVNARHLLIAADVAFEEGVPMGDGILSALRFSEKGFALTIADKLSPGERSQLYAHCLAHLMLHSNKFEVGNVHVETIGEVKSPYPGEDPLNEEEEAAAKRLALEILIPTIPLREAFLYFEGNTQKIAEQFGMPTALTHIALVQRKLMDARSHQ